MCGSFLGATATQQGLPEMKARVRFGDRRMGNPDARRYGLWVERVRARGAAHGPIAHRVDVRSLRACALGQEFAGELVCGPISGVKDVK